MARILIILLINFLTLSNLYPECCCNRVGSKNTNSKTSNIKSPLPKTENVIKTLKAPSHVNINDKNMKNNTTEIKEQYIPYGKSKLTDKAGNNNFENNIDKAKNNNGEHKKNVFKNNDKNENIETYIDAITKYYSNLGGNEKIYGVNKDQFKEYYIDDIFLAEFDSVASSMEEQDLNEKKIEINKNILYFPEIETNKEITLNCPMLLIMKSSSGEKNIKMRFSIKYRLNIDNYKKFLTSMNIEDDLKFVEVTMGAFHEYKSDKNPTEYFIKKIVNDLKDKNITVEILEIKCENIIFANNVEEKYNKINEDNKQLVDKTCNAIFTLIGKENTIKQHLFKIFIAELFRIYINMGGYNSFKYYKPKYEIITSSIDLRDLKKNMIDDIPNLTVIDNRKLNE